MRTTRRAFVGGAAGAVALPGIAQAGPDVAPWRARREVVLRGAAIATDRRGRRVLVGHHRRRTVAIGGRPGTPQRLVDVGGQPVAVAVAPDGRTGAVTMGFWDGPGLVLLDLATGEIAAHVDVGPAPGRVAFTPDGTHVVLAGGEQDGTVTVVDARSRQVVVSRQVGAVPRGLALTPDGRTAWVALSAADRVARVDLHRGRVVALLRTPAFPDRVALSPDGERLLLTHAGRDVSHVTELDVRTRRTHAREAGPRPSGVGFTRDGAAVVALGGASGVVVLGRRTRHLAVPAAPRDLAVAGRHVLTVSDLSAEIGDVRV